MIDSEKETFRQIGIGLINEYRVRGGFKPIDWLAINTPETDAFIRSIQLHEKTKKELQDVKQEFDDFRQEVSDAVMQAFPNTGLMPDCLGELIIHKPNPDPLAEALEAMKDGRAGLTTESYAKCLRAALDALGFEIRKKDDD